MVGALGVVVLLVFLASAVSVGVAFVVASRLGLLQLILMEISSRRRWEAELLGQFQRMGNDYDRIVRDVARNRNDTALLRKRLVDAAATVARSYDKTPGEPADQRIIKGLVEQLSKLSELSPEEQEQEEVEIIPEQDLEIPDEPAITDPEKVGLHLNELQVLQLVNAAVRQDRIDLLLQPIIGPAAKETALLNYEMFSRIRIQPDVYLPPERYIEVAMRQDLVPAIDNLLLLPRAASSIHLTCRTARAARSSSTSPA